MKISQSISVLLFLFVCYLTPSYQYQKDDIDEYNNNVHPLTSIGGNGANLDEVLDGLGRPIKKPHNLSCHVCHSATNSDCFNFTVRTVSVSADVGIEDSEEGDNQVHQHHFINDGSGFVGFPQKCENENSVCMVRNFAFSQSNGTGHPLKKIFAIKRNCTDRKKCENGCVVMGERTRIYVCSTCCTTPLCNVGNSASKIFEMSWKIVMLQFISTLSIIVALKVYIF